MSKSNPNETPEEYKARRYAQRRQWVLDNPDAVRSYGRKHYAKNAENRRAASREYNREHAEERRAYNREYYKRKKAEDPDYIKRINEKNKARQRKKREARETEARELEAMAAAVARADKKPRYYDFASLVRDCNRTLNIYAYTAMERARALCVDRIDRYFIDYPFEKYGDKIIRKRLHLMGIYDDKGAYDDCYDAGMLAYLYSIHRCAALNCDYTVRYIYKMVRIYILCALILYRDSHNLCKINDFKEIRIDSDENRGRI